MNNKYLKLNKNEKKKERKKYYATKEGASFYKQMRNLTIISIAIIIFGIFVIFDGIFNTKSIWDYVYGSGIFLIGIIFLIQIKKLKNKNINEYVIKKKH